MGGFAPILFKSLGTGIGFKQQSNFATALTATDILHLSHISEDIGYPDFQTETDVEDLGKGGVAPTQVFKIQSNFGWPFRARLSSLNAALIFGFALGGATKATAGSGYKYTSQFKDDGTDSNVLPVTTIVQQYATDNLDVANLACACSGFTLRLASGTGRDTAIIESNWVGSGKFTQPSTITLPSVATEEQLNSGQASALTIRTVNYISNTRFINLALEWNNNIADALGFYPGSGSQSGFTTRGRHLRGTPTLSLTFRALFQDGSTEIDDFLAQTEGSAAIDLTGSVIGAGPETHKIEIDLPRLVFSSARPVREGDYLAVDVTATVLKESGQDWITTAVTNVTNNMLAVAT